MANRHERQVLGSFSEEVGPEYTGVYRPDLLFPVYYLIEELDNDKMVNNLNKENCGIYKTYNILL